MILHHEIWKTIADAKQSGQIFTPVGTTMVRYLESLPYIWCFLKKKNLLPMLDTKTQVWRDTLTSQISEQEVLSYIPEQNPHICRESASLTTVLLIQTRLFLRPGIPFRLTDEIITNFHLPKSSLMMLVSGFMGRKNLLKSYQEAIYRDYHFYSFGDGMWIKKQFSS